MTSPKDGTIPRKSLNILENRIPICYPNLLLNSTNHSSQVTLQVDRLCLQNELRIADALVRIVRKMVRFCICRHLLLAESNRKDPMIKVRTFKRLIAYHPMMSMTRKPAQETTSVLPFSDKKSNKIAKIYRPSIIS